MDQNYSNRVKRLSWHTGRRPFILWYERTNTPLKALKVQRRRGVSTKQTLQCFPARAAIEELCIKSLNVWKRKWRPRIHMNASTGASLWSKLPNLPSEKTNRLPCQLLIKPFRPCVAKCKCCGENFVAVSALGRCINCQFSAEVIMRCIKWCWIQQPLLNL